MASPLSSSPSSSPAEEQALQWLLVLRSGEVSAAERQGFDIWLAASREHAQAWARIKEAVERPLARLRQGGATADANAVAALLAQAQSRGRARRRTLRGALAVAGLGSAAALLLTERQTPLWQVAVADAVTSTGERRPVALPDGSRLLLDARSAVDLHFGGTERRVVLRQGALVADVAPAISGLPSFVVATEHGTARALGTRLAVRIDAEGTTIGMLEHSSALTSRTGQRAELAEGTSARIAAASGAIEPLDVSPDAFGAWQDGRVELHDRPLGELVDALRPYRRGWLRISPAAAALRVYGAWPLDDTDRTLAILADTLPVRVHVHSGGWLVRIEAENEG